jgi:hypothetical protein
VSVLVVQVVKEKCGGYFPCVFDLTDAWHCQELKSDMDVCGYRIIVQYQYFGVIASKPKLRTHADMM